MLLVLKNTFDAIIEQSIINVQYSLVSLTIINDFENFINLVPKIDKKDKKILLILWNIYKKEEHV